MAELQNIAGVVLAGGRSSRMGQNKALLDFHGRPLIEHMIDRLQQAGIGEVFISGHLKNYDCLPDRVAFSGPATAIRDIYDQLATDWQALLIIPVDMPFLDIETLQTLMKYDQGACYENRPLPLYLPTDKQPGDGQSVRQMISGMGTVTLPMPAQAMDCFQNLNTPEEWQKAVG